MNYMYIMCLLCSFPSLGLRAQHIVLFVDMNKTNMFSMELASGILLSATVVH